MDSLTDEELLYLLTKKDEKKAFTGLYKRYWTVLYDLAYKRVKNSLQAEDIVQDIFISLWTRRRELEISNLPAYLHTAVRFRVLNYVARNRVADTFYGPFELITSRAEGSDSRLLQKEILVLTEAYIQMLPIKRREIFILYFIENLSVQEIAAKLQVSRKTVLNQLGNATRGLHQHLASTILLLSVSIPN